MLTSKPKVTLPKYYFSFDDAKVLLFSNTTKLLQLFIGYFAIGNHYMHKKTRIFSTLTDLIRVLKSKFKELIIRYIALPFF